MSVYYDKSITIDFGGSFDSDLWVQQIEDADLSPTLEGVEQLSDGETVRTTFDVALAGQDLTDFNALPAEHTGTPMVTGDPVIVEPFTANNLAATKSVVIDHARDPGGNASPERMVLVRKLAVDLGTEISSGWIPVDTDNLSTNEANINNGNFTDLWYNNSAAGQAAGAWVGLDTRDNGNPQSVTHIKLFDYFQSNVYLAQEWKVQGADDAAFTVNLTDLLHVQNHVYSPDPNPFIGDLGGTHTYNFLRVICIVPNNATYWVLAEIQFFATKAEQFPISAIEGTDYEVGYLNHEQTRITNISSSEQDFSGVIWTPQR